MTDKPLLTADNLTVSSGGDDTATDIVRGISFAVGTGEIVGLVGESGSGKSLTALAIMGLLPPPLRQRHGSITLAGEELTTMPAGERRQLCGRRIAMIFQNPMSALNPVRRAGEQIAEMILCHKKMSRRAARAEATALLDKVRLPQPRRAFDSWPHELSGGQRQRVMIAMALACAPALLIADEPTTALDATVQAQILLLLAELSAENKMAVLLITHDFGVVAALANRVAVMYRGQIVETAATAALLSRPAHPYTDALLRCIPQRAGWGADLPAIGGRQPPPNVKIVGCGFAGRCELAQARCHREAPPVTAADTAAAGGDDTHQVRCFFSAQLRRQNSESDDRRAAAV